MIHAADSVMAVPMNDLQTEITVAKTIVGICRAAFSQSKVVALLSQKGMLHAASPNQRLLFECYLRLQWLSSIESAERPEAIKNLNNKDHADLEKTWKFFADRGTDLSPDEAIKNKACPAEKAKIPRQVTDLRNAVETMDTHDSNSYYVSWRLATKLSHPTSILACAYGPSENNLHWIEPETSLSDLGICWKTQINITLTVASILIDEGNDPEIAWRFFEALQSGGNLSKFIAWHQKS